MFIGVSVVETLRAESINLHPPVGSLPAAALEWK